ITLDASQRSVVERAVREVCQYRRYALHAINVRTNHAHSVVTAMQKPEPILDAFKGVCNSSVAQGWVIGTKGKTLGSSREHDISLEGTGRGKSHRIRDAWSRRRLI